MIQANQRLVRRGVLPLLVALLPSAAAAAATVIVHPPTPARCELMAAREVQRYVYLRTGVCLPLRAADAGDDADAIVIATDDNTLAPQQYRLRTTTGSEQRTLHLTGGSPVATLYAAYHFARHLGVRFYVHGDVIPDERLADWRVPALDENHTPLFNLRGIQPFHDFPEGPDWWNADDYRAHLSQLVKLRMNFIGLHCYPESHAGPEPTVWLGLAEDIQPDGRVTFSYPSRYASTRGGAWGYAAVDTSDFTAGAALAFPTDSYGPDVTRGHRPMPTELAGCNEVFNRTATMLRTAFNHARQRGIQVCVGTETPLTIPTRLQERLRSAGRDPADPDVVRDIYRGTFTRIARAYPIDYYWLWTPEGWTWNSVPDESMAATMRDLELAYGALQDIGTPFGFATCGWVLGPPKDRTAFAQRLPRDVAVSCINRQVGFTPVDPAFAEIDDRPQWAIPWLEDDPAMITPQLWVGRLRRDAADALAYGCTGLLGIHWRTRILGPNIAALAQAGWEQRPWNDELGQPVQVPTVLTNDVHVGGTTAHDASHPIAGTEDDVIYQTCRYNVDGYRLAVPNGTYDVTLQFAEFHYEAAGRRVFGVRVQGRELAEKLDVFARVGPNVALDLTADVVCVDDGMLRIDFDRVVELPFIAGITVTGRTAPVNQLPARAFTRKINCGGGAVGEYEADLPPINTTPTLDERPRDLPARDFYADWAATQFGPAVATPLARLFTELDGGPRSHGHERLANLPRPAGWYHGPGGIFPNRTPWSQERERYAFVERMAALRPQVRGPGNRARFDYWLSAFRYLRSMGELSCARGQLDLVIERLDAEQDAARKTAIAREDALPLRRRMARLWQEMMTHRLASCTTPGGLGTIANLEQHVRQNNAFLTAHDEKLTAVLATPLPNDTQPGREYTGTPLIFVPTVRPDVSPREALDLRVVVLSSKRPRRVTLHWRCLGDEPYAAIPCDHVNRGVYTATLPPAEAEESREYYFSATLARDDELTWPATAPAIGQTIVVAPWTDLE